ncbi:AMP-binding enzyme family protein [Mycobacterium kansasii]|uniref:AMP-binding enzyme family protein n=1 Tax=Mycobacterium kansasii TaxID=1768 RepID=A0A1V3WZ14_MYCKA|nr:AMP-binding enzyme family protein [Mycobacterium kansasii]
MAQQFAADGSTESSSPRIADLVTVAATRRPEAVALVVTADRVAISYRDVIRLADDLAGQLTRAGLLPGDRVALRSGSNAEFVVTLLAASRADLVVVRWIRRCPSATSAPAPRPPERAWCWWTAAAPTTGKIRRSGGGRWR